MTDQHGSDPALIRHDPSKSVAHLLTISSGLYLFKRSLLKATKSGREREAPP
jgi:hypothetical protein